jgi:carboxyl-terminal processing protease
MKQTRRLIYWVLLTVALGALLGGLYGQRVEAMTDGDETDVHKSLNAFTQVYDVIEKNYADPVDPDKALFGPQTNGTVGAIPGMLRTLDPHSNFFDPRAFAALREDQEGRYYGVGMTIQQRPGKMGKLETIVLQPIPGSPAFRAGLRPGDVIVKVDGTSTDGLQSDRVAEMLKGPKGTVVRVTIGREGYPPLDFTITRDEISRKSLDDVFMIQPGVAYIHIDKFNETTNDELTDALRKLNVKTLKGLVLDLRGNPGGLLQEAVEVSDHFLEKHQLIVYHYGRHSSEKRYYAQHGDNSNEYPIIVLINRMTASAAEIVTGALQDHDRALVIGEPSFGKGLVQTVYPLSEHTGLALTTAHYYTPSGRLIQRDYSNVSLYDYYYRPENAPTPHEEVRLTDGGREVYGGGGITPDVKFTGPALTPLQERLVSCASFPDCGPFFEFGKHYLGVHKTVARDFTADDQVVEEFGEFLNSQSIKFTPQDLKDNSDFIKKNVRYELLSMIYGEEDAKQLSVANDPLVEKALASFPEAEELLVHAKKYMASKDASPVK